MTLFTDQGLDSALSQIQKLPWLCSRVSAIEIQPFASRRYFCSRAALSLLHVAVFEQSIDTTV